MFFFVHRQVAKPPDDIVIGVSDGADGDLEAPPFAAAVKADHLIDNFLRGLSALGRPAKAKEFRRLGAMLREEAVNPRRQAGRPHDARLRGQRKIGLVCVSDDPVAARHKAGLRIGIKNAFRKPQRAQNVSAREPRGCRGGAARAPQHDTGPQNRRKGFHGEAAGKQRDDQRNAACKGDIRIRATFRARFQQDVDDGGDGADHARP